MGLLRSRSQSTRRSSLVERMSIMIINETQPREVLNGGL